MVVVVVVVAIVVVVVVVKVIVVVVIVLACLNCLLIIKESGETSSAPQVRHSCSFSSRYVLIPTNTAHLLDGFINT